MTAGREGHVEVRIDPLSRREEFEECVRLQEETWGTGFSQRVPEAVLIIASRLGGVVSGARLPDGSLGGFVFGLTGIERGRLVHWSDMLAVRPGLRGRGIGTALKLHQRERVMALGVLRMYWTFDPLEARNAKMNLSRFGAVAREHVVDMYGASGSPLHAGIGTDRFIALWELDSDRVRGRLDGTGPPPPRLGALGNLPRALEVTWERGDPVPGEFLPEPAEDRLLVPIPDDVQALKAREPELARQWRTSTRAVFGHYLAGGWEVRELVHDGNLPHYLLVRREESGEVDSPGERADGSD